ncbi:L-threonylcarbamoyladenylate synthase [filamentous cyanobacterium LEGE 11480]|uniref:L-threonylcarbamoyladenylate synthase n=1 Tax=Romeriopsis navalis LEGE 11480 TaxID=2777977 RepID=A0A928Z4P5_9CYAN|nr:L-threonylcarbamoyladenylate synthase [Romeriopsis navalis]MBE9030425.1 L-threonylcarbamoyladenylate synthase [Romeriopsis navalis LEGE 11480]
MSDVTFLQLIERVTQDNALASFPTDTVPALAAIPHAADKIYATKQRSQEKPLILMAGESEALWDYLNGTSEEQAIWRSLMEQYWPGALTLVLPASSFVPIAMNPQHPGTIGIRIPNHPIARQILQQTGPLATTSANRSGQPALLEMREIAQAFPQVLQLTDTAIARLNVTAEALNSTGTPSTVAKWQGDRWAILRQGAVILPQSILQAEPRSIQ